MAQFKAGNGRLEIRLSGSGGQGVITAGVILAEAAILDGKNAVQSQSYGPESRGGYSKCEVILSDGEIDYPKVSSPDVLLALTEEALAHYGKTVKTEGLLIADESIGEPSGLQEGVRVLRVPILQTAREKVGREITANVVALGVLA
ncbi:MAG: 2-oxoacid:acceptor oxidoreductase family protein, partial [Firmicutes bacterium]|nr:2-oxoacid:acceptor oxidoreductase family protein [Bacillota bacterium]